MFTAIATDHHSRLHLWLTSSLHACRHLCGGREGDPLFVGRNLANGADQSSLYLDGRLKASASAIELYAPAPSKS